SSATPARFSPDSSSFPMSGATTSTPVPTWSTSMSGTSVASSARTGSRPFAAWATDSSSTDRYGRAMTLTDLAERFWRTRNEFSPTIATVLGVHDHDDQLRRYDDEWLGGFQTRFSDIAAQARALTTDGLTTQERITRELLIYEASTYASEIRTRYLVAPIDPFIGPHRSEERRGGKASKSWR